MFFEQIEHNNRPMFVRASLLARKFPKVCLQKKKNKKKKINLRAVSGIATAQSIELKISMFARSASC
jgi:hypothetical protein